MVTQKHNLSYALSKHSLKIVYSLQTPQTSAPPTSTTPVSTAPQAPAAAESA